MLCVAILSGYPSAADASLEGDAELLLTAAAKYRENLAQLRTWKGKVTLKKESEIDLPRSEHPERLAECAIDFAYNARVVNIVF